MADPQDGSCVIMDRDHLFISYATEDWPLAEWLTRRLTAEGYRVWCDRFKLLGGESYPKDIDKAIGEGTFRFLALLSRFSKTKDNPLKERTKALNVGRALGVPDFVVPLNVDGLAAAELDWMTSDLTFIPFYRGWATGFRQMLEKLRAINCPKPLVTGRQFAIDTFMPRDILASSPQILVGNCLPFSNIPNKIVRFTIDPPLTKDEQKAARTEWPYYFVSPREVLAFQPPESSLLRGRVTGTNSTEVADTKVSGIHTENVVSSLLVRSVQHRATVRGLYESYEPRRSLYYFPAGLCEGDRLQFPGPDGGKTWIGTTGERTYWSRGVSQKYRYHLGTTFRVRRDVLPGYTLQITPVFRITDTVGNLLLPRTIASRRKRLGRDWWNREWLNRHLGLVSFLAGGEDPMVLGGDAADPLHLSAQFLRLVAPFGLNEVALEYMTPTGEAELADEADDGEDDEFEADDVE